ncbi:MAG TPA: glutathione S-transferase family protein [Burkholderiaceae bacterium]|nr:glutathione S-transferase family protein [Burkholderiaceae bacterium]
MAQTRATDGADVPFLHHYDFSPFSEKVRVMLGRKGLAWRSVTVPSVMPKPELTALTGGYRHVPVLQIGADAYCDTRCIARELDRRWPEPPLSDPRVAALETAIEAWVEGELFWAIARFASGVNAETVDPRLHVDRATLRGKPPPSIDRLKAVARRSLRTVRAALPAAAGLLAHGRPWLLSDAPGRADFAAYHTLWFLGAFEIDCSAELDPYPALRAWMARMAAIGHGRPEPATAAESLAAAAAATPAPARASVDDDAMPALGRRVAVRPDGYATEAVEGVLRHVDADDVSIGRTDPVLGEVTVHLPRIGYTMTEARDASTGGWT